MAQSKKMSLVETVTSTAIGYVVALITQMLVFPLYDLEVTIGQNIGISVIFTVVSLVRGYFVRRLFNREAEEPKAPKKKPKAIILPPRYVLERRTNVFRVESRVPGPKRRTRAAR